MTTQPLGDCCHCQAPKASTASQAGQDAVPGAGGEGAAYIRGLSVRKQGAYKDSRHTKKKSHPGVRGPSGTVTLRAMIRVLLIDDHAIVREGFKPWERTVNLSNGQKLNVGLEMTDAGYARWQDATRFINDLKNGAKLTDAQVKVLEGEAKMLEQSGFKVDTKEGIQITNKSLF